MVGVGIGHRAAGTINDLDVSAVEQPRFGTGLESCARVGDEFLEHGQRKALARFAISACVFGTGTKPLGDPSGGEVLDSVLAGMVRIGALP
jgi:hypothetical protein